jgi:hypothetical protein
MYQGANARLHFCLVGPPTPLESMIDPCGGIVKVGYVSHFDRT